MKMIRTNYFYPKQMLERLRQAKELTGLSVSELIRQAIDKFLKEMRI